MTPWLTKSNQTVCRSAIRRKSDSTQPIKKRKGIDPFAISKGKDSIKIQIENEKDF